MPSDLYSLALASLTDAQRTVLERFTAWLETYPDDPSDGARLVQNFRAEAHLVGDSVFGDPAELTAFLQRCAAMFDLTSRLSDQHRGYQEVCREFSGRGLRVLRDHLPDLLLRYSRSRALLELIVEQILGDLVRTDLHQGLLAHEKACELLRDTWDSLRLDNGMLGVGPKVFATFEHAAGAPRNDAVALSQALALPFWQWLRTTEEILFELAYPTDAVADPRFPTVAEDPWSILFEPAEERPPDPGDPHTCCGWTRPLGPNQPQPEILHDNAPVSVLQTPPRWVGRIPL